MIILKVYHNISWGKCILWVKRVKFVKNREKLEIAHKMLVLEQNIPNQKFSNTFSVVQLKTKYFTLFFGRINIRLFG
jgi:hypothetical protein